jgi:hypothetical protein
MAGCLSLWTDGVAHCGRSTGHSDTAHLMVRNLKRKQKRLGFPNDLQTSHYAPPLKSITAS